MSAYIDVYYNDMYGLKIIIDQINIFNFAFAEKYQ